MIRLRGYVLGRFRVLADDRPIDGFKTRKSRSLLGFLMLNAGRSYAREVLVAKVWGEDRAGDTLKALRQELWTIRTAFRDAGVAAEDILTLGGDEVTFTVPPEFWLDAREFAKAMESLPAGTEIPVDADQAAGLEAAMALYDDDLLPGIYDDWCLFPREALRDRFISGLEMLLFRHQGRASWDAAVACAKRLLDADPLLEHVHRDLMRTYYAKGNRPAALRQFEQCKRLLQRELGIEPMAETVELYRAIREEHSISVDRGAHPESAELLQRTRIPSPPTGDAIAELRALKRDLRTADRRIDQVIHEIAGR